MTLQQTRAHYNALSNEARDAMIQRLADVEARYLAMGMTNAARAPRNMAADIANGAPAFLYRNWTRQLEEIVARAERERELLRNAGLGDDEIDVISNKGVDQ